MKKLMTAIILATTIGTAQAATRAYPHPTYNAYAAGYSHGKNDAYQNTARTLMVIGVVAIAGIIIYEAGRESRWGVNENGITYKF
jgi:hypothetical protein